jgi:hypothetical protein
LDGLTVPGVLGEKPDVCSMVIVSSFALRGFGVTICVGDSACFCAPVFAELLELPRRWWVTVCLLMPCLATLCDLLTATMLLVGEVTATLFPPAVVLLLPVPLRDEDITGLLSGLRTCRGLIPVRTEIWFAGTVAARER